MSNKRFYEPACNNENYLVKALMLCGLLPIKEAVRAKNCLTGLTCLDH